MAKNGKKFTAEKNHIFLDQKLQFYLSLGLHKRVPKYRRSIQPLNENIHHLKT
jgi:hypothetical protein